MKQKWSKTAMTLKHQFPLALERISVQTGNWARKGRAWSLGSAWRTWLQQGVGKLPDQRGCTSFPTPALEGCPKDMLESGTLGLQSELCTSRPSNVWLRQMAVIPLHSLSEVRQSFGRDAPWKSARNDSAKKNTCEYNPDHFNKYSWITQRRTGYANRISHFSECSWESAWLYLVPLDLMETEISLGKRVSLLF